MTITPLPGSSTLTAAGSPPAGSARPVVHRREGGSSAKAATSPSKPHADELQRLKDLASQIGLQVRYETLPHSSVTVLRLIDSQSGRVVGEFPPEGVAQALADVEARTKARSEQPALDQRA